MRINYPPPQGSQPSTQELINSFINVNIPMKGHSARYEYSLHQVELLQQALLKEPDIYNVLNKLFKLVPNSDDYQDMTRHILTQATKNSGFRLEQEHAMELGIMKPVPEPVAEPVAEESMLIRLDKQLQPIGSIFKSVSHIFSLPRTVALCVAALVAMYGWWVSGTPPSADGTAPPPATTNASSPPVTP